MVSTVQDKETGLPWLHVWNKCNSLSPTWSQRYGEARVPQVDFVGQSLAHKEIMIWRQFSIILPSVFHKFFNTKTSSINSVCSYSIKDDWFNQYADLTKKMYLISPLSNTTIFGIWIIFLTAADSVWIIWMFLLETIKDTNQPTELQMLCEHKLFITFSNYIYIYVYGLLGTKPNPPMMLTANSLSVYVPFSPSHNLST